MTNESEKPSAESDKAVDDKQKNGKPPAESHMEDMAQLEMKSEDTSEKQNLRHESAKPLAEAHKAVDEAVSQASEHSAKKSGAEAEQSANQDSEQSAKESGAEADKAVNQATANCDRSASAEDDEATVTVSATSLSGSQATVSVPTTAKVLKVKQELAPSFGLQPDQLRLLHGADLLEDDSVLSALFDTTEISLRIVMVMPTEVSQRVTELSDTKTSVRVNAAHLLGGMGERARQAVPYLENALTDESEDVQIRAAEALGMIGEHATSSVPALKHALERQLALVRRAKEHQKQWQCVHPESPKRLMVSLLDSLGKMGKVGVPVLRAALKHQELRIAAVAALAKAGEVAACAVSDMLLALKDCSEEARKQGAQAIVRIGDAALPALEEMLAYPDDVVSDMAATALGGFGASALPSLQQAMTSNSARIRRAAAGALGQTKVSDSMSTLENALCDADFGVCATAVDSLGVLGDVALPALEQVLLIDYWAVHGRLVEILEGLGWAAIPLLEQMMRKCSVPIRIQAIEALCRLIAAGPAGDSSSQSRSTALPRLEEDKVAAESVMRSCIRTLVPMLEDIVPCMRHLAARTLGVMGPAAAPAAPALAAVLQHERHFEEVRQEAAQALASIGRAAVPRLECVVKNSIAPSCAGCLCWGRRTTEDCLASRAAQLAVVALGQIGDAAVPALVQVLETPELHHMHATAVVAFAAAIARPPAARTAAVGSVAMAHVEVQSGTMRVATRAVHALAGLMTSSDVWLRWEVMDAFAMLRDVEYAALVVPVLVDALGDVFAGIRVAAAAALGKQGVAATPAVQALEAAGQQAAQVGDEEFHGACNDAIAAIYSSATRAAVIVFRRRVLKTAAAHWAAEKAQDAK